MASEKKIAASDAAAAAANDPLRLILITDATGSMGTFLQAVRSALWETLTVQSLSTRAYEACIGWYRDYSDGEVFKFSELHGNLKDLEPFIATLHPSGGGDTPEAAKTALVKALPMAKPGTIVLFYTDAPPHHPATAGSNWEREKKALGDMSDWVKLARAYQAKGVPVYVITNSTAFTTASFFVVLSQITGGQTFYLNQTTIQNINKTTINLFLGLKGCPYDVQDVARNVSFGDANPSNIVDECDNEGFLPGTTTKNTKPKTLAVTPFKVEARPELVVDPKDMLMRFVKDPVYKKLVYRVFDDLLNPEHALAITHNSVFGLLWRSICTQRQDEERETLILKLNQTIPKMPSSDSEILRKWISESYNSIDDIKQEISEVPEQYPAIVLSDLSLMMSREDILEATRACNRKSVSSIVNLLSKFVCVEEGAHLPEYYLPLQMHDRSLFSCLPHLMAPGLKFSLRGAVIVAMVVHMTQNSLLSKRAAEFLAATKGKWFHDDETENFTHGFASLALKAEQHLTDTERQLFKLLFTFGGFQFNGATRVNVVQGYTPRGLATFRDFKKLCNKCNKLRSMTLILKDGTCGLCAFNSPCDEICDDTHSQLAQCSHCTGLYSVVSMRQLLGIPKCHYCRLNVPAPLRFCRQCHNKFVVPEDEGLPERVVFDCAECVANPKGTLVTHEVPVSALFNATPENRADILRAIGLEIPADMDPFDRANSLHKIHTSVKLVTPSSSSSVPPAAVPSATPAPSTTADDPEAKTPAVPIPSGLMSFKRKDVMNSDEVIQQIVKWVLSGNSEIAPCYLCADAFPRFQISEACGNCPATACKSCLDQWYKGVAPGRIVLPHQLSCPFCKLMPKFKVLRLHNREATNLRRVVGTLDPTWYYAWCLRCSQLKQYMEKHCADAQLPVVQDFTCHECQNMPANMMQCPACHIPTIKELGCDHISCPCGAHWCYVCGKESTEGDIYDHMRTEHPDQYFF